MKFKITHKGKNPYDLNSPKFECKKCGGDKHPTSQYEPIGYRKICTCKNDC